MISGATKLAAVVGDPVRHSLSPTIHNAAFAANRLDWRYVAFPVASGNGAAAVEAMRTLGIAGLSVTMPHKASVAIAADRRTPVAERLGVANCLYWDEDQIIADTTDGDGFVAGLNASNPGILEGAQVAILGAGGAARSIVEALGRTAVTEILVVNRTLEKAEQTAELAANARSASVNEVDAVNVVVNATAVGMAGGPDPAGLPCPPELIQNQDLVVDIVYNPIVTPLLRTAQDVGIATAGGLPMLVHQAALAFERWTGERAPLAAMSEAATATQLASDDG